MGSGDAKKAAKPHELWRERDRRHVKGGGGEPGTQRDAISWTPDIDA